MANFGGRNELERRLRTLLQTEEVYSGGNTLGNTNTISFFGPFSDDQARQLGQVLLEGHRVTHWELDDLSALTASGDYQPLMDFLETDSNLREIIILIDQRSSNEVTSRFFRAISRSKFISSLVIRHVQYVPTEVLMDLLHGLMPLTKLTIDQAAISRNDQEMESALFRNITAVFQAMKSNASIHHLTILAELDKLSYEELAQVLPFLKGLRQLACEKWPPALNATMKEAFRQNGSLVDIYLNDYFLDSVQLDAWQEHYLKRNRGIQRTMESPGTIPDNLIPLICAAAGETNLGLDLIFELVKAKAHLFQDLPGKETQNNDLVPLLGKVPSNEDNDDVECSVCCLM